MMNAHSFIHSFILFILVFSSLPAFSQISRPAAYLNLSVPAGSSVAVALPFDPFHTNIYASIAEQLGNDGEVLLWNAAEQKYETPAETSATAIAGDAFWVINESEKEKRIFLSGTVSADQKTVTVIPLLNLIGNPFISMNTNHIVALDGDTLIDPRAPDTVVEALPIGQGMWYARNQSEPAFITFESPLAGWPVQDGAPDIANISMDDAGTVQIAVVAEFGTEITLFRQDISLEGTFDYSAWQQIASGVVDENGRLDYFEQEGLSSITMLHCYIALAGGNDLQNALENKGALSGGYGMYTGISASGSISDESVSGQLTPEDYIESESVTGTNTTETTVGAGSFRVIYVSSKTGRDDYTGKQPQAYGMDGPKRTVRAGLRAIQHGDRLVIKEGVYHENLDLTVHPGVIRFDGRVHLKKAIFQPAPVQHDSDTNSVKLIHSSGINEGAL